MQLINDLVELLNNNATDEIYWLGAADEKQICVVEAELRLILPEDYKCFLTLCGGGGVIGE